MAPQRNKPNSAPKPPAANENAQPAAPNNVTELPVIEKKKDDGTKRAHIGAFAPNMLNLPNHEQLLAILLVLGLNTKPIFGKDSSGNLVDQNGNVVIPIQIAQFFELIPVTIVPNPAPPESNAGADTKSA